ncbi:MAG TPA: HNH endonuclease [Bryobacteraceae bacterium]|nr:HNH endonuclease [Bryobacteraceae bacterium]
MEGWIAPTDYDWYSFLRDTSPYEEVNFWTPSDYFGFRGTPGAPFLFKLKAAKSRKSTLPHNVIAGFGIVSRFAKLEDWLAWDCFGKGNGAADFSRMKARIDDYRGRNELQGGSGVPRIGCIILSDAVFFPPELCIPQPADWPSQNLRPMRYDLSTGEGRRIWEACQANLSAYSVRVAPELVARVMEATPRYGEPVLVQPRIGQGVFRIAVTDAYGRACAITGEHSLPALEAAHIKPYAAEGPHDVPNGLLLRSDLHRLFDKGYVTVTTDLQLEVSNRLKEDYSNGRSYYPLHGQRITIPSDSRCAPSPEFLRWHNDHVFRA